MEERAYGAMTVRIASDSAEMADAAAVDAASVIREAISHNGSANVMFATGNSQLQFLDALVVVPDVDWSRVVLFHMDEYVGVGPDHPSGFGRYIRERIAARAKPREVHYIRGDTGSPADECRRYTDLLKNHPLDLCCLGVGENGHLAFNDPPVADFDDPLDVKVVELDRTCREQQVGEGHFASVDDVPTHAITVTIPALLRALRVIAVVPESRKAEQVRRALLDPVGTDCPASALRTLGRARMYLDPFSASLLPGH